MPAGAGVEAGAGEGLPVGVGVPLRLEAAESAGGVPSSCPLEESAPPGEAKEVPGSARARQTSSAASNG